MPTFQPSPYSYGSAYHGHGALALQNRGAVAATAQYTKTGLTTLFTGGAYGISEALKGKAAKLADAEGNALKWKQRYLRCKKKRQDKGKSVYPGDPGKGPFYRDCREKYKEWKHFEKKAARLAKELQQKLDDQGKLSEEAEVDLLEIQAQPEKTTLAEFADSVQAYEENRRKGKRANKPKKENFQMASLDPEGAAATIEGEGYDGLPLWVLGVGALAAVGGIAYYVMAD